MEKVYLSRRNLETLLSKLDRKKEGDDTKCTIIKKDDEHPEYPQTIDEIKVKALENEEYYTNRDPGIIHEKDRERID